MRRFPWRFLLGVAAAAAVLAFMYASVTANNVTVTELERRMELSQTGIDNKDCLVTGLTSAHKVVSGYGPSSFCTSVKVGDTVAINDGIVTKGWGL